MLVTRTIDNVVWSSGMGQLPGASQLSGGALVRGFIYFRPDTLPGEVILKDHYEAWLNDGTRYVLGNGDLASKLIITSHGLYPGKEACVEVQPVPGVEGIGMNSLHRITLVQEDDGYPEDAGVNMHTLRRIIGNAHGEISKEIEAAGGALSTELIDKIDGVSTDLTNKIDGVSSSLTNKIDGVNDTLTDKVDEVSTNLTSRVEAVDQRVTGVDSKVTTVDSKVTMVDSKVDSSVDAIAARLDSLTQAVRKAPTIRASRWDTPGPYTLRDGVTTNLFDTAPTPVLEDAAFVLNTSKQSFKVTEGVSEKPRILRVGLTASLEANPACDGYIHLSVRDSKDSVMVQTLWHIDRTKMEQRTLSVQFSFDVMIDANSSTHPALTDGIRVSAHNRTGETVQFMTGTMITAMLTSVN